MKWVLIALHTWESLTTNTAGELHTVNVAGLHHRTQELVCMGAYMHVYVLFLGGFFSGFLGGMGV